MIDPDSFRQFEHSGWQNIPQQYHQAFSELTAQSIEPLLGAAEGKKGKMVPDIATVPGDAPAAAPKRGAAAIRVDFATPTVAEAHDTTPDVEYREGGEAQSPFGNDLFGA